MNQTQYVYLLLTDTGSWFTRTIKQYTRAPYNHASIAFDDALQDIYSFGRKHPLNPVYGGFVREDIYHRYYRYFPQTTCALYALPVDEQTANAIRAVIQDFQTKPRRYTYNYVGLLGVVFNYPITITASYFCSQFVAEVLNRAGVLLWDKPPALVTPEDVRTAEGLVPVYEGKLADYPRIQTHIETMKEARHCPPIGHGLLRGMKEKILGPNHAKISQMTAFFTQKIKFEDVLGKTDKKRK